MPSSVEHGIEVLPGEVEQIDLARRTARPAAPARLCGRKQPELDLTVEPSLDSLRLYLRAIGKVSLLTAGEEVILAKRIERGDMGPRSRW